MNTLTSSLEIDFNWTNTPQFRQRLYQKMQSKNVAKATDAKEFFEYECQKSNFALLEELTISDIFLYQWYYCRIKSPAFFAISKVQNRLILRPLTGISFQYYQVNNHKTKYKIFRRLQKEISVFGKQYSNVSSLHGLWIPKSFQKTSAIFVPIYAIF